MREQAWDFAGKQGTATLVPPSAREVWGFLTNPLYW
jgi:hypothetical protein